MLQKFSFQAVTREGKAMTGTISAESINQAHEKLATSGLSILSLEAFLEKNAERDGLVSFEFQALSPDHKVVKGTIEAVDEYSAYKKLSIEYLLKLNYLVSSGLPPEEKLQKQQKGIDPALEQRLQEENKGKEKTEEKKEVVDETGQILEEKKKEMEFMQEKVWEIIKGVQGLIEKHGRYLVPEKKRGIEEKLDLLARLRKSNSIDHLRSLVIKTTKELVGGVVFLEEGQIKSEEKDAWLAAKAEFQAFGMGFEKDVNKGLAEIQSLFANIEIDPEKLKKITEELKKTNPVEKFFTTIFYTFSILFCFCFVFWIWIAIQGNLGLANFFFHSGAFWYITIASFLLASFLAFGIYSSYINSLRRRWVLGVGAVLALLFITIEFYLIFFWI